MTILILATEEDAHARAVSAAISDQGGESVVLDLSLFPQAAELSMRFDCCGGGHDFRIDLPARGLSLGGCGAVWWRRPQQPAISPQIARHSHRMFAANESQEALAGLWFAMGGFWINPPAENDSAGRKGYQLRLAQQLELDIPQTLMTNAPARAAAFLDARAYQNVICKSFSSTLEEWRETRMVGAAELAQIDQVRFAPVIFQEYIEAVYDLRIAIVGDRLFPAAIHSSETAYPIDSRVDIANARVEAATIPAEIEAKLLEMMRRLGLVYAAVDMRLTPDGDYVFLELNPAGQWLFADPATNVAITAELARLLVEGDRRTRMAA